MKVTGYHIAYGMCCSSRGTSCYGDLLEFLLRDTKGCIGVFYHLDYAVAQLLEHLGMDTLQMRALYEAGEITFGKWVIRYVPKKFLNITCGTDRYAAFTNLSDTYQWHHDSDLTVLDIDEYAAKAQEIGEEVYATLVGIGLNPRSLVSPANAFGKDILSGMDLPTVADIPDRAGEYAYNCMQGSWVEAFRKGHFIETWDYDIRGAYSRHLAELLDTRYGDWIESKEYIDDAWYGYCRCWVNIDSGFSPVQHHHDGQNYTPTGPRERFLNLEYIDFIEKYGLGTCEILDGWWWVPKGSELVYPMEEMIMDLNRHKEKATGLARKVIKRIPNGIWGKLIEQRRDNDCWNFMPPWACEAETRTTLAVAGFVLDNGLYPDDLLHIAVDGVLTSRPVELGEGGAMGDWQLTARGPAFVIGSGQCALQDRPGEGDFALNYGWLVEQINERPGAQKYGMEKLSPVSLAEAVRENRYGMLGKHQVITRTVDVAYESKRNYPAYPMTGQQLLTRQYNSIAWDISNIQGLKEVEL